jgi:hypothetical protein
MIGENIDLDLLSLLPQEDARIIGGIGGKASSKRSTMMGENLLKRRRTIGKEGLLNRSSKVQPL